MIRTHRLPIAVGVAVFVGLAASSQPCLAQWLNTPLRILNARPAPRPPDSILVRFRPGKTLVGLAKLKSAPQAVGVQAAATELVHQREIPKLGVQVYRLGDPSQMKATLDRLNQMPEVLYAEPNSRIDLLIDPNDTYYAMEDTTHAIFPPDDHWPYQWPLQFVQAPLAWSVFPNKFYTSATKPANSVKVAVIDTGIDVGHPDFINSGGVSTNATQGGQLDLADSRNMLYGGSNPTPTDPSDDYGHGTHVAGIVGAATNNAEGVAALGYNGQIMTLKVTDESGDGDDADVIQSIIWAVDHGALIINISLALNGGYSQGLQDAVNYAWLHNVLVVAAAGNDGVDYVRRYPAACDKVLAVGATTFASFLTIPFYETNASYSNLGLYVGIAAPGGDASYFSGGDLGLVPELYTLVWSTTPTYDTALTASAITEYTYGYLNGTSMASPHVAGLATLYAGFKGFTQATVDAPTKMIKAIQKGADNLAGRTDGGWTTAYGHGRINAYNTMKNFFGGGRASSSPGCITGQVTYFGTPVLNAAISAVKSGSTRTFSASSKEDGTYRLANMPAGTYTVTFNYIGLTKTKSVVVDAATDTPGVDMDMDASGVAVTVTPHTTTLGIGGSFKFTATVTGATNTGVAWSVVDGPGTIGADGTYFAPTAPPLTNIAEVQATSLADPTKFDIAQVTIAVTPASVTFNTNPVLGGANVTATVTLSGNAPAGGATVTLASDNTAVATVPASVVVAAATKTANFTVNTSVVTASSSAKITATYNGGSASGTLTVNPPAPQSLVLNPTTVWGTQASSATLTLNGNAPSGGMVVALGSSNTSVATVPVSVTVAAGTNQAVFNVTTLNILSDSTSNITATANGVTVGALLTVKAAKPTGLTLNPLTVRGGKNSVGTVTLNGPAPTGGLKVNLTSSNTAAAKVNATMTVGAGKMSGNFTITTFGVASTQTSTITASARGATFNQTLTINPAVPKSIVYSPNPATGGTIVTATLNLDGKAPAGGLVVTLSSEKPAVATVPGSVTVAAGASTATFSVTTFAVAVQTSVKIHATANGVTIMPGLTVKP